MGSSTYGHQLQVLENFLDNLMVLRQKIEHLRDRYHHQITAMESAGFMEDYIMPLRERYQSFSSKIDGIEQLIESHQNRLKQQQEAFRQLQQIARG